MARKKTLVEDNHLSPDQLKTLVKVMKDPFLFSTFCYVINPVLGMVKFILYPFQRAVLYQFMSNRFNIILKFRQAGITELISLYCLWLAMYHPNKKINIISIKDTVAKKVLKKIKFMYKNLPQYLQEPIVNGRTGEFGSVSTIEFANGSVIESIPTSDQAGRSESLSLLVIDEAAIVRWASTIWASAFPTLSCSVGSTKLFRRVYPKGGNKYSSVDTEIIKLRDICPRQAGILDISNLGYYTLTHTGEWKLITHSQNKGRLETWFVKDNRGKVGGYTPAHRLFTTHGWKTVKEIVDNDLNVISVDTKVDKLKPLKLSKKPKKEVLKPIEEFPTYFISNIGRVYKNSSQKGFYEVKQRLNKDGYPRVGLIKPGVHRETGNDSNRAKSKTFQRSVHLLVAEAFLGKKPDCYQVDHIDNIRTHNYVTNLRYVSVSENVSKSFDGGSLNALLNGISYNKLPDLLKRGRILEMAKDGYSCREIAKEVYPGYTQGNKFVKRILTERLGRVYISKLTIVKKTVRTIYDIQVDGDHSYISSNNFVNHNTGGAAIVNSTPYGIGNFFHGTWVDAISGGNPFNPIRLYWQMHPDRDQKWYEEMSAALGPKRTAQEIDGDFLSSGNTVFDLADIKAIEECLFDYPVINTRLKGQYREFSEPDPDKEYFIGGDCATGRGTDYSAFTCMDRSGEEAAVYKGRIPLNKYARLLGDIGEKYNFAKLAPETNDVGMTVTSILQDEGYPNLYFYTKLLRKRRGNRPEEDKFPGWLTTSKNRSVIIENLEKDIREENVIIKDPFFIQEAYTFIYDGSGRPIARGKHRMNTSSMDIDLEGETYSDDSIFGKAITNHIRNHSASGTVVIPQ